MSKDIKDIKQVNIELFNKKELLYSDEIFIKSSYSLGYYFDDYKIYWQGSNYVDSKDMLIVFIIYYENNSILFQYYLE